MSGVESEAERNARIDGEKSFSTDVLKLVTGTTLAQVMVVLASPVLTRLYTPEAFGLLALFTSITKILSVVSCLRYEFAIMLPDREEEAANLLGLCLIVVTGISLLTVPLIWIGEGPFLALLNAESLADYIWFIPPFVFMTGIFLALNYWNSRSRHYGRLSMARMVSALTITGTQMGAGAVGLATGGSLISASVFGTSVATLILGWQIARDDLALLRREISWGGMKAGMIRYKKFPLYESWSGLLNVASWQLPSFLLAAYFSTTVVGFYSIGFRLIQMPMDLVGGAIQQVFFQRASDAQKHGSLSVLTEGVFGVLLKIGLYPMLLLSMVGEDLFVLVFGSAWGEAGFYTQLLSVWALIWFITSPLSTIYMVQEKQGFGLKINIANFVTRLLALVAGGMLGSARIAILLFAISGIAVYGYLCLQLLSFSGVPLRRTARIVLSNVALFVPAGALILVLKYWGISPIIQIVVGSACALVYYLYTLKTDPQIKELLAGFR